MKKIFVMIGIPGSGKSTWINRNYAVGEDIIVSRDKIRFLLLKDDENYFAHENEVFDRFIEAISFALTTSSNVRVFADATHLGKKSRKKLLKALALDPKYIEINAVYMNTPLNICLERNAQRTGREKIPENVIKNMYEKILSFPAADEGFKKIYLIDNQFQQVNLFEYNKKDIEKFKY